MIWHDAAKSENHSESIARGKDPCHILDNPSIVLLQWEARPVDVNRTLAVEDPRWASNLACRYLETWDDQSIDRWVFAHVLDDDPYHCESSWRRDWQRMAVAVSHPSKVFVRRHSWQTIDLIVGTRLVLPPVDQESALCGAQSSLVPPPHAAILLLLPHFGVTGRTDTSYSIPPGTACVRRRRHRSDQRCLDAWRSDRGLSERESKRRSRTQRMTFINGSVILEKWVVVFWTDRYNPASRWSERAGNRVNGAWPERTDRVRRGCVDVLADYP